MISLEQIHTLEKKVQAAVSRIRSLSDEKEALTAENVTLKERLESYEERVAELQTLVSAFKADQEEIEAGIVAALGHLDQLEDTVSETSEPPQAPENEEPERQPTAEREPEAVASPPEDPQPEPPSENVQSENVQDADPQSSESDGASAEDDEPELDIF